MAQADPYAAWYAEALEHMGLVFERLDEIPENRLAEFDVLLLCGRGTVEDPELLEMWCNQARGSAQKRAIVASGGTWGIERLLGVTINRECPRIAVGLARPVTNRFWPEGASAARFFGGSRVNLGLADAIVTSEDGSVTVSQLGQAWFVAPHVGQTMAFLQLGTAVETDGVGAPDGSAHWDTGQPRAEYGTRLPFEGRVAGVFADPHADVIRELWFRTILEAVRCTGKRAAVLWHLPRNANHMGILSLDCDSANATDLFNLNATLLMTGTRATVLSRQGGFGPDVYAWLKRVGHEVGFSFNPAETGGWHPDKFRMNITGLQRLASIGPITTTRPIGGAWRGFLQPYEVFALSGIRSTISKGGTERGTSGFLFGTCHPFMPLRADGRSLGIIEFPYQLYNVGVVSLNEPIDGLVATVAKRHGVLHGVTSLSMVHDEQGFSGLKRWISILKQSQADFTTIDRLSQFERMRRECRLVWEPGKPVAIEAEEPIDGLTLMVQGRDVQVSGLASRTAPQMVHRYGQEFIAITLEMGERRSVNIRLTTDDSAAA